MIDLENYSSINRNKRSRLREKAEESCFRHDELLIEVGEPEEMSSRQLKRRLVLRRKVYARDVDLRVTDAWSL